MPSPRELVFAAKERMERVEKALRDLVDGPRSANFRFEHARLVAELQSANKEYIDTLIAEGKALAGGN